MEGAPVSWCMCGSWGAACGNRFSFYHVSPRVCTRLTRLGSKPLLLLSISLDLVRSLMVSPHYVLPPALCPISYGDLYLCVLILTCQAFPASEVSGWQLQTAAVCAVLGPPKADCGASPVHEGLLCYSLMGSCPARSLLPLLFSNCHKYTYHKIYSLNHS